MSVFNIEALTCEYRTNPLGADVAKPRFGWKLASDRRAAVQTAYRVQVAEGTADFASPVWDTDKVASDRSIMLEYDGQALKSRTRYHYRIKAWDNFGRESEWSDAAWFETAFLSDAEWRAQWITPDTDAIDPLSVPVFQLRKAFSLKPRIASARVYATAAGLYEFSLNGSRVGDELLAPGWTSYNDRLQYQTYDVTDFVQEGENAVGVLLGNGWYKGDLAWEGNSRIYGETRACLLQLHVRYEDGSEETIVTDPSWKAATGPILLSDIYEGEIYDARLEKTGWNAAGYDDSEWSKAAALDLEIGKLVAQENVPVRVIETLRPIELIRTPSGETVVDMGQNLVGRVKLTIDVPAGTRIRLQHAEVLDKEGNFYTENLRSAKQIVEYVAKGGGTETFAPHLTFQGFRYVKVEGYPGQDESLPLDAFLAEVIHSDMEPTGDFDCSHPLVNQLQSNIRWGQRGNFVDVPTDCPQRDERLGWTGDAQVFIRTAAFLYQVGPFFTKWLRDLKADQKADGSVPYVIPDVLSYRKTAKPGEEQASAAWADASTVCPWTIYVCYGDERLLGEQFDSMKAWVEYVRNSGDQEFLWNRGFHFGDWLGLDAKENSYIGATPKDLIATAYFAYSTQLVRDAAIVLGHSADVRKYGELYNNVKRAFADEFLTPNGRLAAPTQTAHVLALMFNLVEGETRVRIARDLNELVKDNGFHLTTGFVGTPHLCHVLSDNGYHETAVKLFLQENYPSWLYPITKGATTIWEHWDGIKPDGSFWSKDMNSYNHYAYGAIGDWMYRYVAGLGADETVPGYKRILVRPQFAGEGLTHARATLNTPYGVAESAWRLEDGGVELRVTVPANASAEVLLPGATLASLAGGGAETANAEGVLSSAESEEGVRLSVGSGTYSFRYARGA